VKDKFEIYYEGKPLPLPSGEIKGATIWEKEDAIAIENMASTDFSYYNRLLNVCIYGEDELEELKKLEQAEMIARFIKNHSKDFD
jgi:hypothetical protein